MITYNDVFERGTGGLQPYSWQRRLAEEGLPETVEVPTGCGKTLAVVLAWLFRRRFAEQGTRIVTPRRLVFALPMRTLVEQTQQVIADCLARLDLADEVIIATLMGGEPASDEWRLHPERDAIVVCTLDMGLSGALNRAYGSSRYTWPVTFGLLNTDTHWVFDEVQLMGPAAGTSRQLQAFRAAFGVAIPASSTWMSATLDVDSLCTVDAPAVAHPLRLQPGDEPEPLMRRLGAPKVIERWLPDRSEKLDKASLAALRAEAVKEGHVPGTRTLAILNTVEAARLLHAALVKQGLEPILFHSRFRPPDRLTVIHDVLAAPGPNGSVVVATQVVEAGVDISSATLFTEVAPWPSIVQRAGRCNRFGEVQVDEVDEGLIPRLRWDEPLAAAPYRDPDLAVASEVLGRLTGSIITTRGIGDVQVRRTSGPLHQVLRRADLLRLFDTAPDLAGNDLDISPYIRDGDDLDVRVCWRAIGVDGEPSDPSPPARDELCPVPVGELRTWLKGARRVLRLEHVDLGDGRRRTHRWVLATADAVRPGQTYIADAAAGGYTAARGWDPSIGGLVELIDPHDGAPMTPIDETMGDDPASFRDGRRVTIDEHLDDVKRQVEAIFDGIGPLSAPAEARASAVAAGRWHDLGKVHPVFQATLVRSMAADDVGSGPWAKSGRAGGGRHQRPHFRHELASALALLGGAVALPGDVDRDLAIYLVAAHHGRVRMAIRSYADEGPDGKAGAIALGIHQGDRLDFTGVAGVAASGCTLDLAPMRLGAEGGSWVDLATRLRDRPDLGPFRLAHLEAIVRVADWLVSASYDEVSP